MDSPENCQPSDLGSGVWPLEGHFACGAGFRVAADCLGESFSARTASYEFAVTLPRLGDPGAASLSPPDWAFIPHDNEGASPIALWTWGRPHYKKGAFSYGRVTRCRVSTKVPATNSEQFHDEAIKFGTELEAWWRDLVDWLEVLEIEVFEDTSLSNRPSTLSDNWFDVWTITQEGRRTAGMSVQHEEVDDDDTNRALLAISRKGLRAGIELAVGGTRPPAEWLFVRDARALERTRDYRRSVIDAGTAAELAMTALLERHLATVDPVIRQNLMKANRGLDRRAELMRSLGVGKVPTTFAKDLNQPRTVATHGRTPISGAQARAAIAVAQNLVEQAYPRADLN